MNTRIIALSLAGILLAMTPAATATYTHADTLHPLATGVLATSGHEFRFPVAVGDKITLTLVWTDTEQDLDLRLYAPGGSCRLAPDTDVDCVVGGASESVNGLLCPHRRPLSGPHGSESISVTATVAGTYQAHVLAALAPRSTDYTITITVLDKSPQVEGPSEFIAVGNNPVCKL